MAESDTANDQMALRRRARRRLVGAVALALAAILILPMLFDPEPKPLGPDVDIRIPSPDTPFERTPPIAPAAAPPAHEPAPQAAEPTQPAAAPMPLPTEPHAEAPKDMAAKDKPAPEVVEKAMPKPAEKPTEKPPLKTPDKPREKTPEKAADKAAEKSADKPPLPKPSGAFASRGFFLQLGAFGQEANARQLLQKAADAGFKPALADSNGQYRVRIGPYPDRDQALQVQQRLKAKGFGSVMIGP